MSLTVPLVLLFLPFGAFIAGQLAASNANTSTEDPAAIVYFLPFCVTCLLAAFAALAIWAHVGANRDLSAEEKKQWKRDLLIFFPLGAVRYWARFR